jgi:GNAT superfamily N-acetyltransferase
MANGQIEELTSETDLREAYPVMDQLRPVGEEAFLRLVAEMRDSEDYRLFALRDGPDDEIRALAGVAVGVNLYHGKHVWIHDLVVDEPHRGEGYGSRLLAWVEDWAEARDCTVVELASGLWRDEAHEFYEQNGMERYCYTFKSELSAESPY